MMQRQELNLSNSEFFSDDILLEILGHLPPEEIAAMAFVSKRFANFMGNDLSWGHKFERHYPEKFKILSEQRKRARDCYEALTEADKALFPEIAEKLSNYWYMQFVN